MSSSAPTEVGDRLERLAEHAPLRLDDPNLLWSRGRRRQRSRWAGTAAGLVVLAVLGAVAVPPLIDGTPGRQGMVAVSPDADLVLPDVVRQPGEFEPAFRTVPGRLVAVGLGARGGWWSSRNAWWGVSGATGESRFLDLPDAYVEAGAHPALSDDGRRLAYWFTGVTTEEPVADGGTPVLGVAVLDLTTGDEVRWDTDAPRGMMTDGLEWAGDVLWWAGGPYEEGGGGSVWRARVAMHTWDLSNGERQDLGGSGPAQRRSLDSAGPAPDGFLVRGEGGVLRLVQDDGVARTVRLNADLEAQQFSPPTLSPGGTIVAGLMEDQMDRGLSGGARSPLLVGQLSERRTSMTRVGALEAQALAGWRSEDELVVITSADTGDQHNASFVTLSTGEVTRLLDVRGTMPTFAYDAWAAEVVPAPPAPWAPDPRVITLAVLLLAGAALWAFQRVRRRRVGT